MKKNKWPAAKTERLLELVAQGLCRREIAGHMGLIINAVTSKLIKLGVVVQLEPGCADTAEAGPRRRRGLQPVNFPRFEDITRAEAAAIRRGAPPSGRLSRTDSEILNRYSLTGSTAALCAPE